MAVIEVDKITYGYSRRPVLKEISLSFKKGEIISILGPNGSGKTTFLKLLLGICHPQRGKVRFEGRDVLGIPPKQLAKQIAYVPQVHRLSFAYRVMDVVLMGRMPHKPFFFRYGKEDNAMAMNALERLSIAHLKDRPYTQISGGERQLTLIARALAQGANIFIMDEPVSGLDYGHQMRLLGQIADLAENGYTFIKTTHFPEHAIWISDRVVMLKDGQVLADGDADAVATEENLQRLYDTSIGVVCVDGTMKVCIPRNIQKRNSSRNKAPNSFFFVNNLDGPAHAGICRKNELLPDPIFT